MQVVDHTRYRGGEFGRHYASDPGIVQTDYLLKACSEISKDELVLGTEKSQMGATIPDNCIADEASADNHCSRPFCQLKTLPNTHRIEVNLHHIKDGDGGSGDGVVGMMVVVMGVVMVVVVTTTLMMWWNDSGRILCVLVQHTEKPFHECKKIPCSCGKVYIGTTQRSIRTRLTEHNRNCHLGQIDKWAVAAHAYQEGDHNIRFKDTDILSTTTHFFPRLHREAIEIYKHDNNFNRKEKGVKLNKCWYPVLNRTDKKPLQQKDGTQNRSSEQSGADRSDDRPRPASCTINTPAQPATESVASVSNFHVTGECESKQGQVARFVAEVEGERNWY
ncbi:hypothetical protein ANN_10104 [Periplaneta americana]|uniref:GIY-YIG domain-containing protein n=1 Tax=Periplaneta americana TaxID=6978 RepID=A0ABQ8TNE8_PERAM|nr:hypothetical protein ANN_10104 [Periplaneta americana]